MLDHRMKPEAGAPNANCSEFGINGRKAKAQLCFLDLFCGCGGFTLGMERAGFCCLAAVDINDEAVTVLAKNLSHVPHVLKRDLMNFPPAELARLLATDKIDVIVGGPPCQG